MGGGDLNLKKSWDPRRRDNQEKKWKQEEMDKNERRRLKELLEERQEEKDVDEMRRQGEDAGIIEKCKDRVDWMYKGPESHTNPDDYLLGKEVDKAILESQSGQKRMTEAQGGISSAGSVFGSSASISVDAKDMARKMREDPLFAIKKRELNNRKELVSNPIRMKQLQQMLQTQVGRDKKKKKPKKHKEKRSKKHKKSHSVSSDSSSEEDVALSSSKRQLHQQILPESGKVKVHRRNEDRRRDYESNDGHVPSGRDKPRMMSSLDPARMKALLEREMFKKHKKRRDVSESSSSESDSDEMTPRDQGRQEKKSRHYTNEEHQYRHRSQENKRDSQMRQIERSVSPEVVKRKHGAESEKSPMKYGLQRGRRKLHPSDTPSPERVPGDHTKYHLSESRDRRGDKRQDRSPHRVANKNREKHAERSRDRRGDNRSLSPKRDRYTDRYSDERGEKHHRRDKSHSRSPVRDHGRSRERSRRSPSNSPQRQNSSPKKAATKRKLTAEEMEQKRAEMMNNAKWRDEQRTERVKTYEKEEQAELEMDKKKSKRAEFVQPLKLPDNSSIEDRIHRNIYSIQRTKAALDKNFAKR
ncbi:pre-mRNA-splicing factor CWC25 homolog isoform X1 [Acanthaster planci]|uniref:Pre-mRNA-splicing factor CWC25 homolog isoform X1 n=1 Tax=Acanthaster planci TaxID=133434 RepID=A0A8B8A2R1_ACAPL|nr:pre-mRNA-splicing factor CWC25 homolog isoform X1 [Acanthaster planci]XP_022110166.1 pre-mRNA-splicing factor CWC25 homolog isoform X1 [Acanthaster planci]